MAHDFFSPLGSPNFVELEQEADCFLLSVLIQYRALPGKDGQSRGPEGISMLWRNAHAPIGPLFGYKRLPALSYHFTCGPGCFERQD